MNLTPYLLAAALCGTSLLCGVWFVVGVCVARYYWVKTQFVHKGNDE